MLYLEETQFDLAERVKTCRECGYKYSEIPINRGKYEGDNEAN